MGIIKLEGYLLMELPDVIVLTHIFRNRRLHGCGDEEILLFQAQLLTGIMVIVRIQHLHDIPCQILLLHRFLIITFVKGIQLEAVHRLCIPDAQCIDNTVTVTDDRKIVRNGTHCLIAFLLKILSAVLIHVYIHIAAEPNLLGIFRSAQLKRIAVLQPVIGHFNLKSVSDLLFEHTVAVTDTAAVGSVSKGCQGIQETSRQTSQTTVAKSRIRFLILDHIQIQSQFLKRFLHFLICLQIDDVIAQGTAHQEFHGQIVDHLRILFVIFLLALHPIIHDRILDRVGYRLEDLLVCSLLKTLPVKRLHIIQDTSLEKFRIKSWCCSFLCHYAPPHLLLLLF